MSHHVIFDESQFLFAKLHTPTNHSYEFLDDGLSPCLLHHLKTSPTPQTQQTPPPPPQ